MNARQRLTTVETMDGSTAILDDKPLTALAARALDRRRATMVGGSWRMNDR